MGAIKFRHVCFLLSLLFFLLPDNEIISQDIDNNLQDTVEHIDTAIDNTLEKNQLQAIDGVKLYSPPKESENAVQSTNNNETSDESNENLNNKDQNVDKTPAENKINEYSKQEAGEPKDSGIIHEESSEKNNPELDITHKKATENNKPNKNKATSKQDNNYYNTEQDSLTITNEPEYKNDRDKKDQNTVNISNYEESSTNNSVNEDDLEKVKQKITPLYVPANCYFGNEIRSFNSPILMCKASAKNYLITYLRNYLPRSLNILDKRYNKNIPIGKGSLRCYKSNWQIYSILIIFFVIVIIKKAFFSQLLYVYNIIKKKYLLGNNQLNLLKDAVIIYIILSAVLSLIYGFVINSFLINLYPSVDKSLEQYMFISALVLLFLLFRIFCQKLTSTFFESKNIFDLCFCLGINGYIFSILILLPLLCLQVLSVGILHIFITKTFLALSIICILLTYIYIAIYIMLKTKATIIDLFIYLCIFEWLPIILIYKTIEFHSISAA